MMASPGEGEPRGWEGRSARAPRCRVSAFDLLVHAVERLEAAAHLLAGALGHFPELLAAVVGLGFAGAGVLAVSRRTVVLAGFGDAIAMFTGRPALRLVGGLRGT